MRVLAIDPALRNAGWAVLEREGKTNRAIAWGVIRNKPALRQSACLVAIMEAMREVIREHRPDCCAIESTIYVQNFSTAITLGAARAACLMAPAEAGLEICEYPPRRVKQAIVGRGAADKAQVAFMVRALLKLTETPPHDAADALAVGITHLESCAPGSPWQREKVIV
jgi:crossover junction endodeoxyribonuclease RuvC